MEKIVTCSTVVIKDVKRIETSHCTYASINTTDKVYLICECVEPNITGAEELNLEEDFFTFNVAIIDLFKDSKTTLNKQGIDALINNIKKTVLNKVITLDTFYPITLKKENTFVGGVPGNYREIYKKRVSRKMINEIRKSILGTKTVPNIDTFLDL